MSTKRNLRVCQVYYNNQYYDVTVGLNTLDELDNILYEWAEQEFGVVSGGQTIVSPELDLPNDLLYVKNITDVITTLDIDDYVYITSGLS